jgi:hypothetical protein
MTTYRRLLPLVALCAILAPASRLLAEDIAPVPVAAMSDPLTLFQDLNQLAIINGLKLTDDQLAKIIDLYAGKDGWLSQLLRNETLAKLQALRARLIRGEDVSMEEFGQINQAVLGAVQQNTFLDGLAKVFTAEQMADLEQPFRRQMQAAAAKAGAAPVQPLLNQLGAFRGLDDENWVTETNKIADDVAVAAGAKGTPANEQTRRDFVEFLNRIRRMNDKQFAEAQKELLENLKLLVPPAYVPKTGNEATNKELRRPATMMIFLSPRVYVLLQEMRAARAPK